MLSSLRPPLELLGMIGGYLVVGLALVWLLGPLTGMIAVHLAVIVLWLVLRLRARRAGTPLRRPDGGQRRDLNGKQWLTALAATIVIWASAQIIAAWIHAQNEAFGAQLPSSSHPWARSCCCAAWSTAGCAGPTRRCLLVWSPPASSPSCTATSSRSC